MPVLTGMLLTRKLLLPVAILYTLAIGIGSLIHPPQTLIDAPENSDKLVHASAYFFLCIIWFISIYIIRRRSESFKPALYIAMGGSLIYGTIIELLQASLTTYRSGDFYDILANATGIILAGVAIRTNRKFLEGIKSKF